MEPATAAPALIQYGALSILAMVLIGLGTGFKFAFPIIRDFGAGVVSALRELTAEVSQLRETSATAETKRRDDCAACSKQQQADLALVKDRVELAEERIISAVEHQDDVRARVSQLPAPPPQANGAPAPAPR